MNTFRSSGTRARTNRKTTRLAAVLGVAALTLGGLGAALAPANASLTRVGPTNAAGDAAGFPSFYTDANGLKLQMCVGLPRCLAAPGDLVGPDGEGFYFLASTRAAGVDAFVALEGAFLDATTPIVFQRTQYQAAAGVLRPNVRYKITDPYGVKFCVGDPAGGRTRCRTETGGLPGNFGGGAVTGRIGPFLTATSSRPAGFIGNNVTRTTVTGSPTDFNKFRIQGPGIVGTCAGRTIKNCRESSLWTVQGHLVNGPAARTSVSTLDFGDQRVSAPVGVRTERVMYQSIGTAATRVSGVATTGPFTIPAGGNTCRGAIAPGARCTIDVRFNPIPGRASTGALKITDSNGVRRVALTGAGVEAVRPTVVSQSPKAGATGVRLNKNVLVQFSEAVRGVKRTTFSLTNSSGDRVRASVTQTGRRAVLNPRRNLASGTRYTAHLIGGPTAIRDLVNNTQRSTSWSFRTR